MGVRRALGALALLALLGAGAARAAPPPPLGALPATMTMPRGMLPGVVYRAGDATLAAYRAALEHPGVLAEVPCLCGCQQSLGHRSNLDCYVAAVDAAGEVVVSTHGVSCAVCQEITRLAVDGAARGMSGADLRDMILTHYGVEG